MTTSQQTAPTPVKSRHRGGGGGGGKSKEHKDKEKESGGLAALNHPPTVRLKAVVRHLPPLLKEAEFREPLADVLNDSTTDWFQWLPGKIPSELVPRLVLPLPPIDNHRVVATSTILLHDAISR